MKIRDLAGMSKPLEKLIDVIAKGVGAVSARYLIGSEAKGKAKEIAVIADAIKQATGIDTVDVSYKGGTVEIISAAVRSAVVIHEPRVEAASASRVEFQASKRQRNIEQITAAAAIELAHEGDVSDEPVDEDWISQFFEHAESISSEEMQHVWGRLLAGEVRQPGTFSLRTLSLIKSLSHAEAEMVNQLAELAITASGTSLIPWVDKEAFTGYEFNMARHFALAEIGVLYPQQLAFNLEPGDGFGFFQGEQLARIKKGNSSGQIGINVIKFTAMGAELLKLLDPAKSELSLTVLCKHFASLGCECELGRITEHLSDGQIRFDTTRQIKAE